MSCVVKNLWAVIDNQNSGTGCYLNRLYETITSNVILQDQLSRDTGACDETLKVIKKIKPACYMWLYVWLALTHAIQQLHPALKALASPIICYSVRLSKGSRCWPLCCRRVLVVLRCGIFKHQSMAMGRVYRLMLTAYRKFKRLMGAFCTA